MVTKLVLVAVTALVVVLTFAACGGSSGSSQSGAGTGASLSGEPIAQVGRYTITKAMLNEWMAELVGEEYYHVMSQPAPANLATEPPDNQACVASLRTVAPSTAKESELISKCDTLYLSMRKQALEYLVSAFWGTNYAQAQGLAVSDTEAKQGLATYQRREYPHAVDFERLLASRRRTVSQELFLIKEDLLQKKVLQRATSLGHQESAAFLAGITRAAYSVHCRAGYVVEHCQGYKKPSAASNAVPPSALLFEEIGRWRSKQ